MGRRRQRIRRLENEVAAAKAGQAELRRRVEMFEMIAAAAGAKLGTAAAAADVPPSLQAAAQDPRQDTPVCLDVDGRRLIAVVGDEGGDPREWWTAILRLAARNKSAS